MADAAAGGTSGSHPPSSSPASVRPLLVALGVALAVLAGLALLGPRVYAVDSSSMAPLLRPGDRLLAVRPAPEDVRRGDVVVVDAAGSWEPAGAPGAVYVKRVVGLAGERVTCCDPGGRITVDGSALDEPYLPLGESPSADEFDVVVPDGRVWLMGDARSRSSDSRDHLGSPGGGSVGLDSVRGRVAAVLWPLGRVSAVRGASAG